ncbi:hypothetical protein FIU88_18290 (plasmid) [Halomonas sp. THAF12]|uniref:hypothetical protein n=1 Tax=Halomonas sp. THAF12 TaxID=2587849 RepID=UPI0012680E69|nr:hypothetical protein [Halomonas sp. THAF12]QFT86901.1 hypothetical protein FIU88_18290 [Halomonas sp. THAF12]
MTSFLVLLWVFALFYALFLVGKLIIGDARFTHRPFFIRWMVVWATMLALSAAIRLTDPEPESPEPPPAPLLEGPVNMAMLPAVRSGVERFSL